MTMGITNNYSGIYGNTYAASQQTVKTEETKETAAAKQGAKTNNNDYLDQLAKLAPSVKFAVGNGFSTAKSGLTLTIDPRLLEKMQNDPEQERETMELIRGVESMTRLSESINKASGWKTEFRHGYIDENGKYRHIAVVRNEFGYKLSEKLREERRQNAEKLAEKSKEKAAQRKEERKASEEKRTEKQDKEQGKAERLITEKVAASKDGMIYLNDSDFREILEAIREDAADIGTQPESGANMDLRA